MNEKGLMIETSADAYVRTQRSDLLPTDRIVWGGGPDAFAKDEQIQREFESEIAASGGLEAWRKQAAQPQPA